MFDIHQDDYRGINYEVNTFIIYFDVNCNGGELCFYENNETNIPYKIIDVNNPNNLQCKIVMFEGKLYHKPNDYLNGIRKLLSFHIPK